MVRTIWYALVVMVSVLWLPWWTSIALLIIGAIVLRYAFVLLIPALVADYLYAPHTAGSIVSFFHNQVTLCIVAVLLIARYSIIAKTRVSLL